LIFALRPAYTVSYLLYFQMNIDAIIQKYCVNKDKPQMHCNGKCHLMKELGFENDNPSSSNHKVASFLEAFYPLYFEKTELDSPAFFFELPLLNNWKNSSYQPSDFIHKIYHPPQGFIS
jgi:hypothetical protein